MTKLGKTTTHAGGFRSGKDRERAMGAFKKLAGRICAAVLTVAIAAGACLPAAAAQNESGSGSSNSGKYISGTIHFWAHDNDHDLTDSYVYSDSFFEKSSYETDLHLAVISMVLAASSISSKDVDYAEKSRNVQDFLSQIGFTDIEVNQYYREKMQMNTLGVAVAYKNLGDTVLLAIVPRSAGYEAEWGGNFNVGAGGLHEGFRQGRNIALEFTKEYVANHADAFAGKTVKVWTAGYSRGAGVANLIGAALVEDPTGYIGLTVQPEDIYDYTFGTPLTASSSLYPRGEQYNGIHNYFSDYDPVPMMPFAQWGFERYGQDVELDVHNAETKERMLALLAELNPAVYQSYTTAQDPDNFHALTLGVGEDGGISLVPDTERSITQREYLLGLFESVGSLVPTREVYAASYEQAVTEATALLIGEDDATVAAFVKGAGSCSAIKPLAIMLFFYNWAEQYVESKGADTPLSDAWKTEVLPTPVADGATTGNTVADEVLGSDTYREMYDEATSDTLSEEYGVGVATYGSLLNIYRMIAGRYMDNVLRAGLTAIGYTGDALEQHPLIQDNNAEALSEVAAQMLFGTEDSLSFEGAVNKVKNAATAIGNNFMRVHNNEVILSWLRAMDTEPYEEDPVEYTVSGSETWDAEASDGLRLQAAAGVITGFRIDNQESDNCQISEDGQSIEISASLLASLPAGKHTVTVVFEDGEASHEFEIAAAEQQTSGNAVTETTQSPETSATAASETGTDSEKEGSSKTVIILVVLAALAVAAAAWIVVALLRKKKN